MATVIDPQIEDQNDRESAGQYDEQPDTAPECGHENWYEATAYPTERSGRCAVLAICEDCSEQLGQVGWDSVF